mgnify:CR=1 FL=1
MTPSYSTVLVIRRIVSLINVKLFTYHYDNDYFLCSFNFMNKGWSLDWGLQRSWGLSGAGDIIPPPQHIVPAPLTPRTRPLATCYYQRPVMLCRYPSWNYTRGMSCNPNCRHLRGIYKACGRACSELKPYLIDRRSDYFNLTLEDGVEWEMYAVLDHTTLM